MLESTAVMVGLIVARLEAPEFRPFAILMSDGTRHHVPSRDHCTVTRLLKRVEIEHDDYRVTTVNPLHITGLEEQSAA